MLKELLEKTYSELNNNIKFSEAKNAALITLNSALITAGASKVFDSEILINWRIGIAIGTLLLIIPMLLSLFSFRATTNSEKCIVKKIYDFLDSKNEIEKEPKKCMYYAYIAKHYKDNPAFYLEDVYHKENTEDYSFLENQMARQIVDLSGVAYHKFILFNIAVKIECVVFSLGGLVALASVICKFICALN